MVILIDSGSTTLQLAHALLLRSNLTVLTNSLPIGLMLARTKTIKTILIGGEVEANALFEEIGRLKVELDWLKKKAGELER